MTPAFDDAPPPDSAATDPSDESPLVFEIAVPVEEFLLEETLTANSEAVVEFERLIPTKQGSLPYLWVSNGSSGFDQSLAGDSTVTHAEQAASFDTGGLYRIEWAENCSRILEWCMDGDGDVSLLDAEGRVSGWRLRFRFPSREDLTAFRSIFQEVNGSVQVVRLYELTEPKIGQYEVTRKQRAALIQATEMGYFEIPRETTLEAIAESLGISPKATSERLRRGHENLINNTLTIDRPQGVGLES